MEQEREPHRPRRLEQFEPDTPVRPIPLKSITIHAQIGGHTMWNPPGDVPAVDTVKALLKAVHPEAPGDHPGRPLAVIALAIQWD